MPPKGRKRAKDARADESSSEPTAPKKPRKSGSPSPGAPHMSDRRLKRMLKSDTGFVPITIAISGARSGDLLRGKPEVSSGDVANVLLRLVSGVIEAPAQSLRIEEEVGKEHMVNSVAKHFRISNAHAALRYADFPRKEHPGSRPLGSGCSHRVDEQCCCEPAARFVVLSQGPWQRFAEAHGHGAEMQSIVSEQRVVCWRDVLRLMYTRGQLDAKTLILRPALFEIVAGAFQVPETDPRVLQGDFVDTSLPGASSVGGTIFELDATLVRLPAAATSAFSVELVVESVQLALAAAVPAVEAEAVQRCVSVLQPLAGGPLKSLLQKTIRCHATSVDLWDGMPCVPAALVAAATTVLLFADKGSFSPELQLFTRGCTAAFKRVAIILQEDCWLSERDDAGHISLALMALALAMQRMPDYSPAVPLVVATAKLAAEAVESNALVAWRAADSGTGSVAVDSAAAAALGGAARLLRVVRSFEGDMCMFDTVAKLAESGSLPVVYAKARPCVMPIEHMVDQHAFRGIAHVISSAQSSFKQRFDTIFHKCTGFNPRRSCCKQFETDQSLAATRFGQRCCARFVLRRPVRQLEGSGALQLKIDLDSGVLAAGVGPIFTKVKASGKSRNVIVLLGVRAPEDEVVMLQPSRDTKDLFGDLTDTERTEAIGFARQSSHSVKSPLLAAGKHEASFVDGRWQLDGRDWRDVVAEGRLVDLQFVALPAWAADRTTRASQLLHEMALVPVSIEALRASRAGKIVTQAIKCGSSSSIRQLASELQGKWQQQINIEIELGPPAANDDADNSWQPLVSLAAELKAMLTATDEKSFCKALTDNAAIEDSLAVSGTGVVAGAQSLITALVASVEPAVALRAGSLLRQEWIKVSMPTPGLDGRLGSDQLAAYENDWDVWRLLVLISRLAPAALKPQMPPNFKVGDPSVLRCVEHWVMTGARLSGSSRPTGPNEWKVHKGWERLAANGVHKLMEHQRAAVGRMHQRDSEADTGHFLIMDTGLGKTVTSLVYAFKWLCEHGVSVRRILWVTPAGTTENLEKQLRETWAVPVHLVPRVSLAANPSKADLQSKKVSKTLELKDFHVNVLHADHLRTAIDKGLALAASSSLIVFDEVDEMYNQSLRTSAARRLAQLCPKFVAQTATPMRKNDTQLRTWLSDTCSFPVNAENLLVAASGMVSIQLELGIQAIERLELIPMSDTVRTGCRELLSGRCWLRMARLVQENTDAAMAQHAVRLAKQDRADNPSGGVLLVADHLQHAARLIAMCNRHVKTGGFDSLEVADAHTYAIVVVTKQVDRGYNSAVRLGALVTGAYAGNSAARHQIRGRLRRIGQVRKQVQFVTVVVENSILQLLHQRHSSVDNMNISLEQLGQTFGAEVLRALNKEILVTHEWLGNKLPMKDK